MNRWPAILILGGLSMTGLLAAARGGDSLKGRAVFETWCAMCHAPGPTFAGTVALQAKYAGNLPSALEQRADLSSDLVRRAVRKGVGIMPPFRKTELSDTDVADLVSYLSRTPQ